MAAKLEDMSRRGRTLQERDQDDSRRVALDRGGYEKDEQGNYQFTGAAKEHVDGMNAILRDKDRGK
jgi:hypothetical protein